MLSEFGLGVNWYFKEDVFVQTRVRLKIVTRIVKLNIMANNIYVDHHNKHAKVTFKNKNTDVLAIVAVPYAQGNRTMDCGRAYRNRALGE